MKIFSDSRIRSVSVALGTGSIKIPVATLTGSHSGPSLLVTAGVDGDEYAGIAAAYEIIRIFSSAQQLKGTLTVIPVVNIPGFMARMSQNPMDSKYPKLVFPGLSNGSPTERLCNWLSSYAFGADVWVDLHGGALSERVMPFVCAWASGEATVDTYSMRLLHATGAPRACYSASGLSKTKILARNGCAYLMTESGELGSSDSVSVGRHVQWMKRIARGMGMIQGRPGSTVKTLFTHIIEYRAHYSGFWFPSFSKLRPWKRGELIGEIREYTGEVHEYIRCTRDGTMLWGRVGIPVSKGETLAGIGCSE